ncbi:hypothetical protein BBK82_38185 [Lentzea guizhouensis]|uniref:Uncharacterized protein n=1 Tax=Lentzea guizhouensis TaxID=1586287 RepID=A0A1B2HTA8_9PSEU|nr:hypothetical protein [Lentzea guizhouensis]ANZ40951.1 hypothetical protein BBK82_38185 [Lentzea guizhouensis]
MQRTVSGAVGERDRVPGLACVGGDGGQAEEDLGLRVAVAEVADEVERLAVAGDRVRAVAEP